MIPTYVVIPVKDNLPLTSALVAQLRDQGGYEAIFVIDNGSSDDTRAWLAARAARGDLVAIDASGMTLHQMWNDGIALSRALHPACNIAILNNNLRIGPGFLARLASALRTDPQLWAVSPNYDARPVDGVQYVTSTFKHAGLAGFAFMVRGEAFDDEHFSWWYGDDDLVAQIHAQGASGWGSRQSHRRPHRACQPNGSLHAHRPRRHRARPSADGHQMGSRLTKNALSPTLG